MDWYNILGESTRLSMRSYPPSTGATFCRTNLDRILDQDAICSRVQKPQERASDCVAVMQKLVCRLPGVDEMHTMHGRHRPPSPSEGIRTAAKPDIDGTAVGGGMIRGGDRRGGHRRDWRRFIGSNG